MSYDKKLKEEQNRDQPPEDRDYAEYEFDASITEHEGLMLGDQIVVLDDDPGGMYSEDDEGQVVGFSNVAAPLDPAMAAAMGLPLEARVAIFVLIDGTDEPIEVRPGDVEAQ